MLHDYIILTITPAFFSLFLSINLWQLKSFPQKNCVCGREKIIKLMKNFSNLIKQRAQAEAVLKECLI